MKNTCKKLNIIIYNKNKQNRINKKVCQEKLKTILYILQLKFNKSSADSFHIIQLFRYIQPVL